MLRTMTPIAQYLDPSMLSLILLAVSQYPASAPSPDTSYPTPHTPEPAERS